MSDRMGDPATVGTCQPPSPRGAWLILAAALAAGTLVASVGC